MITVVKQKAPDLGLPAICGIRAPDLGLDSPFGPPTWNLAVKDVAPIDIHFCTINLCIAKRAILFHLHRI